MTLGKYAHLWTAIETQGYRDPAAVTASYSNQGVDIGVSRVRTQYGQSQAGKANGSDGIPENSEFTSLTQYPHVHPHAQGSHME